MTGEDSSGVEVTPSPELWAWLLRRAKDYYCGDINACVVALLERAMAWEDYYRRQGFELKGQPEDLWAPLEVRVPPRTFRRPEAP